MGWPRLIWAALAAAFRRLRGHKRAETTEMVPLLYADPLPMPRFRPGPDPRTGPGRTTVLTHARYISDPRRKRYSAQ